MAIVYKNKEYNNLQQQVYVNMVDIAELKKKAEEQYNVVIKYFCEESDIGDIEDAEVGDYILDPSDNNLYVVTGVDEGVVDTYQDLGEFPKEGPQGEQGIQGPQGATGAQGPAGSGINSVSISVTGLNPGVNPTGSASLSNQALTLSLGIPAGAKGETGDEGPKGDPGDPAGFGQVQASATTLDPDEDATVSVETSGTDAALDIAFTFGIPKGEKGDPGDDPEWGNIEGDIDDQTDLKAALDAKQDVIDSSNKLSASLVSGLADVATSGDYDDLTDKPDLTIYAETAKVEDGDIVAGKAISAKAIENVSDSSGSYQSMAFIMQGTGTNNNATETPVAPVAKQLELRGNTIVYNQLIENYNFTAGSTSWQVYQLENNITWTGNSFVITDVSAIDASSQVYKLPFNIPAAGDYILVSVDLNINAKYDFNIGFGSAAGTAQFRNITSAGKYYELVHLAAAPTECSIYLYPLNDSATTQIEFKSVQVVDLTKWFNGDIPEDIISHPEHFVYYYEGELAYNTGELRNCASQKLITVGKNAWDEEYEIDGSSFKSKNYIKVIPNRQYYFKFGTGDGIWMTITEYDRNKVALDTNSVSNGYRTLLPETEYIKFTMSTAYGTTYKHDIAIILYYGDDEDYSYVAYDKHEYALPTDTLRSAGAAYDNILPNGTKTVRIGSVDLSTLTWGAYSTAYSCYSSTSLQGIIKNGTWGIDSNAVSDKWIERAQQSGAEVLGTFFVANDGELYFFTDDSSNTPTGTLYYELATPVVSQVSTFAENIEVDDFGTMEFVPTTGTTFVVPQGNRFFYPADYVLLLDDLNSYLSENEADAGDLVLRSELSVFGLKTTDEIIIENLGGMLRHQLADKANIDFADTVVVDLGSLNWSDSDAIDNSTLSRDIEDLIKKPVTSSVLCNILTPLYKSVSRDNLFDKDLSICVNTGGYVIIYSASNAGKTGAEIKASLKGILLAYEKAN